MTYRVSEYAPVGGEKYLANSYARHFQRGAPLGASPGDFKTPPLVLRYYNKENKAVWNLYGKF